MKGNLSILLLSNAFHSQIFIKNQVINRPVTFSAIAALGYFPAKLHRSNLMIDLKSVLLPTFVPKTSISGNVTGP